MRKYVEFLEARKLAENAQFDEALTLLEQLIIEEPNNKYIKFDYCKLIIDHGLANDNRVILDKVRGYLKEINDKLALHTLERLERKNNNIDEARRLCHRLIKFYPESRSLWLSDLGKIENRYGDTYKALEIFKEAYECATLNFEKSEALLFLSKVEAKLNNFERAKKYLEMVQEIDPEREQKTILQSILINTKSGDYWAAYNTLCEKDLIVKSGYDKFILHVNFYLKYKLNRLTDSNLHSAGYMEKQLLNYDKEETIEHIKFHLEEIEDKRIHTLFKSDIDIPELFEKVQNQIQEMTPYYFDIVDKYIIVLDENVGISSSEETNAIEVATILNTKNILSMYPIPRIKDSSVKKVEPVDLGNSKVKRKSQIEKFNERYNKRAN